MYITIDCIFSYPPKESYTFLQIVQIAYMNIKKTIRRTIILIFCTVFASHAYALDDIFTVGIYGKYFTIFPNQKETKVPMTAYQTNHQKADNIYAENQNIMLFGSLFIAYHPTDMFSMGVEMMTCIKPLKYHYKDICIEYKCNEKQELQYRVVGEVTEIYSPIFSGFVFTDLALFTNDILSINANIGIGAVLWKHEYLLDKLQLEPKEVNNHNDGLTYGLATSVSFASQIFISANVNFADIATGHIVCGYLYFAQPKEFIHNKNSKSVTNPELKITMPKELPNHGFIIQVGISKDF